MRSVLFHYLKSAALARSTAIHCHHRSHLNQNHYCCPQTQSCARIKQIDQAGLQRYERMGDMLLLWLPLVTMAIREIRCHRLKNLNRAAADCHRRLSLNFPYSAIVHCPLFNVHSYRMLRTSANNHLIFIFTVIYHRRITHEIFFIMRSRLLECWFAARICSMFIIVNFTIYRFLAIQWEQWELLAE